MRVAIAIAFAPLMLLTLPAIAQSPVDMTVARASLSGKWEGKLEYRDYSSDRWFGIPVKTEIEDQGDGVTMIRKSDFDDGPTVGNVRITSVELYDPATATVTVGTFRKGRDPELNSYTVRMEGIAADSTHWTMVEEVLGKDDDRPALLRITTARDGDNLETLKEVDFQDDDKVEWLSRNRTKLSLQR